MDTIEEQPRPGQDHEPIVSFDARRYLRLLLRYKWLILATASVLITGVVIWTSRQTKIYSATASIVIDPAPPDLLGQQVQEIVPLGAGNFWSNADYYSAQVKIIGSLALCRRTVESKDLHLKLLSEDDRESKTREEAVDLAAKMLLGDLSVSYPDKDRIVYVTVRHHDANLAAEIANAHIDSYIAYNLDLRSEGTDLASRWLAKEFDAAERELRDSETKLFEYRKDNDILSVSLEDKTNLVVGNIQHYTDELNRARARRIELGALLGRIRKVADEDVLESPVFELTDNQNLASLKAQYYLERNTLLDLEKEFGPKAAEHIKQKQKVDELYLALEREARASIRALEEKYQASLAAETAYTAELERYKREAFELGPKVVEYNRLLRDQRGGEEKYSIVLGRLRTSDLTSRLNTINVRRLDRAQPSYAPVAPNMRLNVVLAVAVSLFLGVMLAIGLDLLDRSIKSADDIQAAAGASLLGIIPSIDDGGGALDDLKTRDLYVKNNPASQVAECCRSIRTNIMFSGADRRLKTVVVSSPNPREGKTTTVMYLGTTMAQSGQRVLLIDTDMRRPRLHQSTGVSRTIGLSNLIIGDADYDDVVKTTDVPNLYVLPCGPTPPNPAELLMSQRFTDVLSELGNRYDRILLDSPPVLAVTDAVVLSRTADGVILVAKCGKTSRDAVTGAARQLREVDARLVGVVLNELDLTDKQYGYYYYSYYGYGYGAGDDARAEPTG